MRLGVFYGDYLSGVYTVAILVVFFSSFFFFSATCNHYVRCIGTDKLCFTAEKKIEKIVNYSYKNNSYVRCSSIIFCSFRLHLREEIVDKDISFIEISVEEGSWIM